MSTSGAATVDLDHLKPYEQRRFVPKDMDFMNIEAVRSLYEILLKQEIRSKKDLEQWLVKRSELESVFDQFGSVLYIKMTCQTDDEARASRYKEFIEKIVPAVKPYDDRLNRYYLSAAEKVGYDKKRYGIYHRAVKTDVELFVKENIPLQTRIAVLSQEYQAVCGAMAVDFEGRERTMPEMSKYLLETDRELRERAWRAVAARRLKDKDKLESIFDEMVSLRHKIAQNAGFKNYRDYKFKALHRFDYTPADCKKYHTSVAKLIVPLYRRILEHRKEQMGLKVLRPWDTAVDPLGRGPLKPFEDVGALIEGCKKIFHKLSKDLGGQFDDMAEQGLLDLSSRKGKAPGGYQNTLHETRMPFIFMNAVGLDGDVRTLLHEAGHAFHAIACSHDLLYNYRHGPMEFNEVASMAMELLADDHLSVFYGKEDRSRSTESHFEDIIFLLGWVATIDAFQHWIYENPKHARQERKETWVKIRKKFSAGVVNWDGLEEEHAYLWHRQLHIFEVPFYYIEYGIAQLGALQVWRNAKKDQGKALADYRKGLSYGGSKPLPELYKTSGIKFDFSEKTIAPLTAAVKAQLGYLQ